MHVVSYMLSPMTWFALFFGAVVGSFLNVCIFRIPEGNFWKHARSVCRTCQTPIPFYYNIPVLSYLLLRGRSACCRKAISVQYPLVELFTALMCVVIYWHFPFVERFGLGIGYDDLNLLRFSHAFVFACLMLVCSVIDLRLMIIPDVISIPMILVSPLVFYLHPDLDWKSSLIGIVAGGGVLYAIAWLYWLVRKEVGMGFGDVKLLAAIGGWLGYQSIGPTIFFASVVGSVLGIIMIIVSRNMNLKSAIPFGPFLAGGALIHLLFGNSIEEWLFHMSLG